MLFTIGPRLLLIGEARRPLQVGVTDFCLKVPIGSPLTLRGISWVYYNTVAAGAQTSPDLSFSFFDSKGYAFSNDPIPIALYGTPGATRVLSATQNLQGEYEGGDVIRLRLFGAVAGPVPSFASVTLYGFRKAALRGSHGNL